MPLRHLAGRWSPAPLVLLLATVAAASAPKASEPNASRSEPTQSEVGGVCFESLCDTDADCWNACSSATSAACWNNSCHYSYGTPGGGGGGGGGGSGPFCPAQLCWDDSQCVCGSYYGYCGADGICH